MAFVADNGDGVDEASAGGPERAGSAYEAAVDDALRLAPDEPGLSRAEVLAVELLHALLDERHRGGPATGDGAPSLDDVVIDLRDRATPEPPGELPVWEYDPPAWLDAERVQPLSVPAPDAASELPAWRAEPATKAVIDWKGTDDSFRFGHSSVRLPFGAIFEEDYALLDRLRPDRDG